MTFTPATAHHHSTSPARRSPLPASADVVVVGGGIVGAAAAAAVAERGASVVLMDKEDGPGREGSGRAQGSLRVQGRHASELPLAIEAMKLWRSAADEVAQQATHPTRVDRHEQHAVGSNDVDFEFVAGGNLYLQTSPGEMSVLRRLVAEAHRAGLTDVQLLTAAQIRQVLPAATGALLGGMWSPSDGQAQPAKATAFYARRADDRGAISVFGTKATRVLHARGRVNGVETSAGRIRCGAVVIAAGVWTPHLAKSAGLRVPLMPVIMSELETNPVKARFEQTIRAVGFGVRQRPDGRTVISAGLNATVAHDVSLTDLNGARYWLPRAMSFRKSLSLRLDGPRTWQQLKRRSILHPDLVPERSPEPRVDRLLVDDALRNLASIIPAFRDATVSRYWGGLIDMTPDGLPIIDHTAGPRGLSVITGLGGHGLHLGPVLGEIAADLALSDSTTRQIDAFGLNRFQSGRVAHPEMTI